MTYASQLDEALARMRWRVEPGRFLLAGFEELPVQEDFELCCREPAQLTREGGETSLLVGESGRLAIEGRHPAARIEADLCWVTFEAPMAWELTGFLALVTTRLAEAGVPLGAICGYSRDSLFIAAKYMPAARKTLSGLFPEAAEPGT